MTPEHRRASPNWRWRTFPVFAAFVAGLLIASLLNFETDNAVEAVVQIVAIGGAAYVLIHLFVMNVIVAGRIKRRDLLAAEGNEEHEYEDVVVYPEEQGAEGAEPTEKENEARARR
jgi:hypothetical protein